MQHLGFDNHTSQLVLTNSTEIVDLSHLRQDLSFNSDSMMLGMTNSNIEVDLSSLAQAKAQDLELKNNTLEISAGGNSADLSSLRVVTLQASINKIDGDDTSTKQRRRHLVNPRGRGASRRLKGDKDKGPNVKYGGEEYDGFTLISSGRLIGLSLTAKHRLTKGIIEVGIVDCSDMDSIRSLGSLEDVLVLEANKPRIKAKRFETPIPVEAGVALCFEVIRVGKVDSEENDNVAGLVLMLEQW